VSYVGYRKRVLDMYFILEKEYNAPWGDDFCRFKTLEEAKEFLKYLESKGEDNLGIGWFHVVL
jgi:hypothetical protein